MPKLVTTDINSETGFTSDLNANFAAVETAFENTLSRDGTSPNAMSAALDMNSNRILNLPAATHSLDPVRLIDLEGLSLIQIAPGTIQDPTGQSGQVLTSDGTAIATFEPLPAAPLGLDELVSQGADQILFSDFSASPAGKIGYLTASTGLSISGTNLTVSMLGLQSLSAPGADRVYCYRQSGTAAAFFTLTAPLQFNGTTIELDPTLTNLSGSVDTANDLLLIYDASGTAWKQCTPASITGVTGSTVTKYVSGGDTRVANTTLTTDTYLAGWSLTGTSYYSIEGCLDVDQTDLTAEFKMRFTTTSAFTRNRVSYDVVDYDGAGVLGEPHIGSTEDLLNSVFFELVDVSPNSAIVTFKGFIATNGAATLDMQWAQNVAAGTSTLNAGSWVRVTKLN